MRSGIINPAFNFGHYKAQRAHNGKILKRSLYGLLDSPEKLLIQISDKLAEDEIRYKKSCQACDKYFNIK
jgi:hypothetical protein